MKNALGGMGGACFTRVALESADMGKRTDPCHPKLNARLLGCGFDGGGFGVGLYFRGGGIFDFSGGCDHAVFDGDF